MGNLTFLGNEAVKKNVITLQNYMKKAGIDAFYFSSSDIFLNEYVPLEDCHRYYVTNFSGSTAEVLVPKMGTVKLFVDGRYYEQADLETDPKLVEVIKVDLNLGLRNSLISKLSELKIKKLGVEGDRIDLALQNQFENVTNVIHVNFDEMKKMISFKELNFNKKIIEIDLSLCGESTKDKLKRILKPNEALFLSSLDSIAWLTNLRRYELPSQSTFRSKALATYDRVYLLLEHFEGKITSSDIEVYVGSFSKLNDFLADIFLVNRLIEGRPFELEKVYYTESSINASDFSELTKVFGDKKIENLKEGLVPYHSIKNEVELNSIRKSFNLADRAIFNTINWIKSEIKKGSKVTELDFYHKCNFFYKEEGAFDQSFNTIAGFGPNSSIIHFSSPSDRIVMTPNELALLDSGGYFDSGYATDTTRSFLTGGVASTKQKEIYTLVLKSLLNALYAVFPANALGATIDGVTRQPMFKFGYNYNHGTGHGVGINVHEGGFRISPNSMVPLKENTVGSIEPGIYIPGFGGVRLENIAIVKKHPTLVGMLCFESLTYVGFDHDLINFELLTIDEKKWLDHYELECEKRGRRFNK
jgi:Xaa-Pro aminopeptidase